MVDLGQYAMPILSAYAGTIGALLVLIAWSVRQSRRVVRRLAEVEARMGLPAVDPYRQSADRLADALAAL